MDKFEIDITELGGTGQGVGNDEDGNIYFVPGTFPGDRVRVATRVKRRYRDAELVEVIQPSEDRVDSGCQYYGECGGCDWLGFSYDKQIEAKERRVLHVLSRSEWPETAFRGVIPASSPLSYRRRVQLHRDKTGAVGFHRRNSNEVVDVDHCLVASPKINEAIAEVKEQDPSVRKWELIEDEGEVFLRDASSPHQAGFLQINPEQNEKIKELVRAGVRGGKKVLELYCGNGNLTFAYRQDVNTIFGFDMNEEGIHRARRYMEENPSDTGTVFVQDAVNEGLRRKLPQGFRDDYDTLVLNPPRVGIGKVLQVFIHENLRRIVYVSCSPVAFAKDIECLKGQFDLKSVHGVDMFPQTHHVELVAVFER